MQSSAEDVTHPKTTLPDPLLPLSGFSRYSLQSVSLSPDCIRAALVLFGDVPQPSKKLCDCIVLYHLDCRAVYARLIPPEDDPSVRDRYPFFINWCDYLNPDTLIVAWEEKVSPAETVQYLHLVDLQPTNKQDTAQPQKTCRNSKQFGNNENTDISPHVPKEAQWHLLHEPMSKSINGADAWIGAPSRWANYLLADRKLFVLSRLPDNADQLLARVDIMDLTAVQDGNILDRLDNMPTPRQKVISFAGGTPEDQIDIEMSVFAYSDEQLYILNTPCNLLVFNLQSDEVTVISLRPDPVYGYPSQPEIDVKRLYACVSSEKTIFLAGGYCLSFDAVQTNSLWRLHLDKDDRNSFKWCKMLCRLPNDCLISTLSASVGGGVDFLLGSWSSVQDGRVENRVFTLNATVLSLQNAAWKALLRHFPGVSVLSARKHGNIGLIPPSFVARLPNLPF